MGIERSEGQSCRFSSWGVVMIQDVQASGSVEGDAVEFLATGDTVKGEFHCSACGYGVTVCRTLPVCPMCGGESWEQAAWSPFGRALLR